MNLDASYVTPIRFFGVLAHHGHPDRGAYFCECALDLMENRCSNRRRREAEKELERASRIIFEKRVPAGRILQLLLLGSDLFAIAEKKFGVRACCTRLAEELNARSDEDRGRKNGIQWTRQRVIQEIWSPSKPVVHYAFSFAFHADGIRPNANIRDFILQPKWLAPVLAEADAVRDYIHAAQNIKINRAELVWDQSIADFVSVQANDLVA